MNLKDSVVWITGASSGIGEALVCAMAREGAKVVLSSRRRPALEEVQRQAGLSDENSLILPLDLTSGKDFKEEAALVLKKFGYIDILINNGGISQRSYFLETELPVVRKLMETNFFGAAALIHATLPHMVARKKGVVVAVTSVVGKYGTPLRSAYSASKHAMHGLHEAIRAEHWKDNINVLIVAPGYIKTNLSYNAVLGDGSPQNALDQGQANGISAEDCAKQIVKAVKKNKREIYPAGLKELAGVYLKRFFPAIFAKVVRNVNVR